jgi:hypothetical protein
MVEELMASLMVITGFCIGLAKIKYSLTSELPEIGTTLFLLMGWFQTSVYMADGVESISEIVLVGSALTAFLGLFSLLLTGLSLFFIQVIGAKIHVVR